MFLRILKKIPQDGAVIFMQAVVNNACYYIGWTRIAFGVVPDEVGETMSQE
jgi:hypothetical protein